MDEFDTSTRTLLHFIDLYEKAIDKEAFVQSVKEALSVDDYQLTLADAYDSAYGKALEQLITD